ncbi:unnamed protein product [Brassica rapa]|uniref:LOB domain-containing protein n=1 Tax=Brassica campestris TaxID=3711 RepID=A0A8D9GPD4_BRACM|nr:unnamed protein product [Brassica rapa]
MVMSVCTACQFMTGPCTFGNGNACIMAPYFPSSEPEKFDRVNKVFGIENVYTILSRLEEPWQRQYAANALCYEAEARIHDPIHGYLEKPKKKKNGYGNLCCMRIHDRPLYLWEWECMHYGTIFPLTEPKKFDRVNKVFGVVNVYKILSRLEELWQHQYAVNALCYEADARIHDPIHGYLGVLPKTLDNISQLDTLDLRNNSLSGFVPPGLKKLNERF